MNEKIARAIERYKKNLKEDDSYIDFLCAVKACAEEIVNLIGPLDITSSVVMMGACSYVKSAILDEIENALGEEEKTTGEKLAKGVGEWYKASGIETPEINFNAERKEINPWKISGK